MSFKAIPALRRKTQGPLLDIFSKIISDWELQINRAMEAAPVSGNTVHPLQESQHLLKDLVMEKAHEKERLERLGAKLDKVRWGEPANKRQEDRHQHDLAELR